MTREWIKGFVTETVIGLVVGSGTGLLMVGLGYGLGALA